MTVVSTTLQLARVCLERSWLSIKQTARKAVAFLPRRKGRLVPDLPTLQKDDEKRNRETEPPADEFIDLHCMWVTEYYTPSHFAELAHALRTLGWVERSTHLSTDPVSWLQELRLSQSGGSWMRLDTTSVTSDKQGSLRKSIRYLTDHRIRLANAYMASIAPSLICIVSQFTFEESSEFSLSYDAALRDFRHTYTSPYGDGYQIHDPMGQKSKSIKEARYQISQLLQNWVRDNMPGLFAGGHAGGQMPTFELLTFQKAEPFAAQLPGNGPGSRYLWTMDMDSNWGVWSSTRLPGLKLRFRLLSFRQSDLRNHTIIAAKDSDLEESIPDSGWLREHRSSRSAYIDSVFSHSFASWGVLPILEGYTLDFNTIFGLSSFGNSDREDAAVVLSKMRDLIYHSADILAVSSDLLDSARDRFLWRDDGGFVRNLDRGLSDPTGRTERVSLTKHLSSAIESQSRWIQVRDSSIRDHLAQYASVLGTSENVRLQRRISWLTWALVLLTVVLIALAVVPTASQLAQCIPEKISAIFELPR